MQTQCALLAMIWIATPVCSAQSLKILLYDYTALTAEETARAARVTEVAWGHAGIQVQWAYCRGALAITETRACQLESTVNEIVLRLVRPERTARAFSKVVLGSTIAAAEGGQYATVFVPVVRARAAEWEIAFEPVLGYVIAHEVGHCLLGPKHAVAGLMRSSWTRQDARAIAQLGLGLSNQDSWRAATRLKGMVKKITP